MTAWKKRGSPSSWWRRPRWATRASSGVVLDHVDDGVEEARVAHLGRRHQELAREASASRRALRAARARRPRRPRRGGGEEEGGGDRRERGDAGAARLRRIAAQRTLPARKIDCP